MPRCSRFHGDDMPLHISQRGNNREACFVCEADKQSYLHGEALTTSRVQLHARWRMINHFHC